MKKKNKNLLDNPHLRAVWILLNSKYPNPRYAWDLDTVVTCDLIVRTDMPSVHPLAIEDEEAPNLDEILNECRELRR